MTLVGRFDAEVGKEAERHVDEVGVLSPDMVG